MSQLTVVGYCSAISANCHRSRYFIYDINILFIGRNNRNGVRITGWKVDRSIRRRERREFSSSPVAIAAIFVLPGWLDGSLASRRATRQIFLQAGTTAGVLRDRRGSACTRKPRVISICVPVIYDPMAVFRERSSSTTVYISQRAAGRHEIALVIFLPARRFYGSCGTPGGTKARRKGRRARRRKGI